MSKQIDLDALGEGYDPTNEEIDIKDIRAQLAQALRERSAAKKAAFRGTIEQALVGIGAPKALAKYADAFKDVDLSKPEDLKAIVAAEFGFQTQGDGNNGQQPQPQGTQGAPQQPQVDQAQQDLMAQYILGRTGFSNGAAPAQVADTSVAAGIKGIDSKGKTTEQIAAEAFARLRGQQ